MRVLLVQAFTAADIERVWPLGLAMLATHLDGHDVAILDLNLHRDRPFDALEAEVRRTRPDVVGFSFRNVKVGLPHLHTDDVEPQRRAVETVARVAPGVPIIAGGAAFSLFAEPILRRLPALAMGVQGEAETRLPALLDRLDRPWEVPGVWTRRDGVPVLSGPPPWEDFAALRPPRRDAVPLAPYARSSFVGVGVQSRRGCPLRCIHCSDPWLVGRSVRARDPRAVADEVEALSRVHGVHEFFFCDQQFNLPPEYALAVCREIASRRLDVRWSAWFNEHRDALSDELLAWARRAGCALLSFSPDHVLDAMLARLGKNVRAVDLEHTWRAAKRHGLDVEYSFFLNAPGEDLRSMAALLGFLARARWHLGPRLRTFSLLLMQPIRIYPHTRIHEMAVEAGIVDGDDDLLEARLWNPAPGRYAVRALQATAGALYRGRAATRRRSGRPRRPLERMG
jgi:anaerobic magnesium-protoporphyrin IX monomethyl ester cyclase